MSINPWMTRLRETLQREGVLSDPVQSRLVPDQYYRETVRECAYQLSDFIASCGDGNKHIHVFVDGVPKKCSEENGSHVDSLFLEALTGAGLSG